jgi:flap endonuclease-1
MGVKLQDIIERNKIEISKLAGKVIAIDAPNIIMGLFNFTRKNPDGSHAGLILDRTQRPISHLYGLLYRINFYYSKNIFPIFCFDGLDSELKKIKTKDRLNDFRFTQKLYKSAYQSGDRQLVRQIAMSKEYLWPNIIRESKQLLGALGVPYLNSPASAESQCAQLVNDRIAYFSNSQDFDSLLFGCPRVIQNLSKSLRRKVQGKWKYEKITPYSIVLKENLKRLEIDQFQLVDMAVLIGNDYFPGIKNIGPKHALKFLNDYRNLEKVIKHEKERYDFSSLTHEIIMKVRKIFLLPDVLTQYENVSWNMPSEHEIDTLLCEEHFLKRERVQNNVLKLITYFEKCRAYFQSNNNSSVVVQKTIDQLL